MLISLLNMYKQYLKWSESDSTGQNKQETYF